jgi:hypothetical protein
MRHRFVPDSEGLEHRFLLVKAFPTDVGSLSPTTLPGTTGTTAPSTPTTPTDPSTGDSGATAGPSLVIQVYPTGSGSTSTPTLPS